MIESAPARALSLRNAQCSVALYLPLSRGPPFHWTAHDVAQQRPNSGKASKERRRQQRLERYFECTWISAWSEERSRVSSLSPEGCYIESRSAVPEGTQLPCITITLPSGELTLQGTVVHSIRGVGFAVQFTDIDGDAHARLSSLVQR